LSPIQTEGRLFIVLAQAEMVVEFRLRPLAHHRAVEAVVDMAI
jgi:hypothetical protein